jgi:RimJ/RimL family protein N-acetyltransferase
MSRTVETERLSLRPWEPTDAPDAFAIYDAPSVRRWLAPTYPKVADAAAMRGQIVRWQQEAASTSAEVGHWALVTRADTAVVGGLSLEFEPPGGESLVLAWVLAPDAWGRGYAAEAGSALVRWAIHERGVPEVFALVQPDNTRAAATAQRMGMEWVTELGHLARGRYQVFRLRHGDLGLEG